jgi:hypothetical protein
MDDTVTPPAKKNKSGKTAVHISKSKYSELEAIPNGLNQNLTSPTAAFYKELLGEPRKDKRYSIHPSNADNPALLKICKTDNAVSFRATGLKSAVDSLKEVMDEIAKTYPDLIGRLNNIGMLVVRYIGGTTTLSNHSWGAAIDLYVDGIKDEQKDNKILHGLALIAPIFNKHGWYSGAGYKPKMIKKTGKLKSNEDSMHFEVSKEKLLDWAQHGDLGPDAKKTAIKLAAGSKQAYKLGTKDHELRAKQAIDLKSRPTKGLRVQGIMLKRGDNGPAVKQLQEKLNSARALPKLEKDSSFGRHTEDAVKYFQRKNHLKVSGIADKDTQEALRNIRTGSPSWYEQFSHKVLKLIAGR